jgi:phage gp29-like protein
MQDEAKHAGARHGSRRPLADAVAATTTGGWFRGWRSFFGLGNVGTDTLRMAPEPGPATLAAGRQSPHLPPQVVTWVKRSRYDPIRRLTPQYLLRVMDTFANGYLREFALLADAIKNRDDMISVALGKREKAVARHGFVILPFEGLGPAQAARAAQHQAALKHFYDQLTVTHALEQDLTGGFRLLVRQMMGAVGARYAVHEIIWRPTVDAQTGAAALTARLNFVPLWFFEATTAKLRFTRNYFGTLMGEDLAPDEWFVTVGDGLLEPLAVCYMFKNMAVKDWAAFCDKFGMPGILARTSAPEGSAGWVAMENALQKFGQDWAAVCNFENSIDLVAAKGGPGALPFPPMVERMDRAIAAICRGADLSTMSGGQHGASGGGNAGRGASVQGEESDILEQDDAELITETLSGLSRQVIAKLFGPDEAPLARLRIVVPQKKDTADTINRLGFLLNAGVPVSMDYARKELGVPPPAPGEARLVAPAVPERPVPEPAAALINAAGGARAGSQEPGVRSRNLEGG